MVRYGIIGMDMLSCMVWSVMVLLDMVWPGRLWHSHIRYDRVWYGQIWYGMVRSGQLWYY